MKASLNCAQAGKPNQTEQIMKEQPYSLMFYIMLAIGVAGVLGFLIVGVGAARGGW